MLCAGPIEGALHLAPADIITELNDLLAEVSQAIFDTNGTLDKFTGDGLMAFWGAPLEQPDHALRACGVGHEERHDYTAIGDTVNLAARLEAATKDAGCAVLVSGATRALLGGDTSILGELPRHGEITVKGRAEAVEAYILAPAQLPPTGTSSLTPAA